MGGARGAGHVAAERGAACVEAARALGASELRVLVRHLLPAAHGYALTQMLILFPALVVAEATLSFVGLGLPDSTPSWGTALQEAANVAAIAHYPWVLLPAVGVFAVTWSVNVVVEGQSRARFSTLGCMRQVATMRTRHPT